MSYPYRIFLIFDGIHYDPLIVESNDVNNPVQTKFSSKDTQIVNMAVDFARDAKAKHQYTDLKVCNINRIFDLIPLKIASLMFVHLFSDNDSSVQAV